MTATTKIVLSDKELSIVKDPGYILTKHAITEKVYNLFAGMVPVISLAINHHGIILPAAVAASQPKIFKGENYRQLPYIMLDYPRCFSGEDIFAIRTMFWWGNFFSITLHLAGKYKTALEASVMENLCLQPEGFFVCIHKEQWQHHFEVDNYQPAGHFTAEQLKSLWKGSCFIKLALLYSLDGWNNSSALLETGYKRIAGILA